MPKLTLVTLVAIVTIAAHAVCVSAFPHAATPLSYVFLVLAPALACATCTMRARTETPGSRAPWMLLALGLLLWTCGMVLSAWEEMYQQLPPSVAWFSDFLYFLYGVPLLLAASSVAAEHRIPMFVWMDGIQAVMTGYLTYIAIFSVYPFSGTALAPVPESTLVLTYNIENLVLAGAATLRLIAQPRGKDRRFYEILCGFLWVYGFSAYVYNDWAVSHDGHAVMDIVVDVPFLLLASFASNVTAAHDDGGTTPAKEQLARVVENGSPVFYTVALLVLSVSLMREHFTAGTVGVFTALVVYAMRTTTLQSRLFRTQRELRDARDRLETMALTDALTGTANRRYFDQTLMVEWVRATRHRHVLALLLIDIDFFKHLNDRHGHLAGDRCLVLIAHALQSAIPTGSALLARYGGEEFAAVLPATDIEHAHAIALGMQTAVAGLAIANDTPVARVVTVSIGIAVFDSTDLCTAHELIDAADRALYRAKEHGRNRIESIGQIEFMSDKKGHALSSSGTKIMTI
ncbi:GGDEF domain-containing protein [Pararobbsia alpina]|uniref:GGDEF domain-containing protein n=1 Tax=Pararobbsia alpina TaxID=621374 RepID=UPI0039A4985F